VTPQPATTYPAELLDYITLSNRRQLRIRPLRRCEEGPIRDLFAHLSPAARYQRFFSPMPTLPDHLVRQLACVDYQRQLALVAEYGADGVVETIALGSFGAIDDGTVEVALVVRDEWQRQHVGTAIAERIMQAAEARGFHRFVANVLNENTAIRRLLKHVGEIVSGKISGGVSELMFVPRTSR